MENSEKVERLVLREACFFVRDLPATIRLRAAIIASRLTPEEAQLLKELVMKTISPDGSMNAFTLNVPTKRMSSLTRLIDFGLATDMDSNRNYATLIGASAVPESLWGRSVE